jgi:hypothetical protein
VDGLFEDVALPAGGASAVDGARGVGRRRFGGSGMDR